MKLTIGIQDKQLTAQGTGQPSFILKAESEHSFSFEKIGLEITFVPEEKKLILQQGGQVIELEKE